MEWFNNLDISNKIAIVSALATFSVSIISTIIALLALRTTKKSITEANRPYVVIAIETIETGFYAKYLVIKNYGTTGAYIDFVKTNHEFKNTYFNNFIKDLTTRFIAPGQSFVSYLDIEPEEAQMEFEIQYSSPLGKYQERFTLNEKLYKHQVRKSVNQSQLSELSNVLNNVFHAQDKSKI
ncbi:hypothetical protein AAGS61_08675 [Lysinibacillus sp. KU-BSD001]|uniref:hypothetical protein n=1 Tax=Lysinibacillus sp. KU-BSD001 TaxID=3141328 RepID=UPI0036ED2737